MAAVRDLEAAEVQAVEVGIAVRGRRGLQPGEIRVALDQFALESGARGNSPAGCAPSSGAGSPDCS